MGCGCDARRSWLNERVPGLGDKVAIVAEPIKNMFAPIIIVAGIAMIAWSLRRMR